MSFLFDCLINKDNKEMLSKNHKPGESINHDEVTKHHFYTEDKKIILIITNIIQKMIFLMM